MYRNGQGVVQDYAEALRWLRKAAEQGNALAMGNLGVMYANAQGVAQDYTAAVSWWLRAAEQGEVISQTHLGSAYYFGQGVPQNHGEAAKWFLLAADQGYANAQYLLGLLYEHGEGVPKNVAEAIDWYHKAAAQGEDEARKKLVTLDADAKAGRAAEAAGNAALQKALAAGKTAAEAWEEAAQAAGRAALNAELAAGSTQEGARQAAQQATEQVRARAPKVDVGEPGTITIEMSVAATPTNPPVIMGSTNLPDGTILSVYLLGDPPACVPDCGLQYNSPTVQSGRFSATLQGPRPLISDSYTIDIAMAASLQSQSVQSVIGKLGEHLRGPYVTTFGPSGQYLPVTFPRDNPSDSEKIVGYTIHYTQKIYIAGNASSDAASRTQAIADFRKWSVKSCTSNIDFVNVLVRSGAVSGSETLGAERQAKIDTCVAQSEAKLQTALKSQGQSDTEPEHSHANSEASTPAASQQQVTCAATGPSPNPVDPALAPRIITWVTAVEKKLGLTAANWHGQPARASNPAVAAALELQALTADWEAAAQPGTVESIFRSAVGHGVNVQYETLMINADPANAKTHQSWVSTEAARAAACLALIRMPLSP
jgi:TPR repeat protein